MVVPGVDSRDRATDGRLFCMNGNSRELLHTLAAKKSGILDESLTARWTGGLVAKILIVDDSPSQLFSLSKLVAGLGHQVITAEDGASGVAMARSERPDLILMDVVMPELNGYQATRTISRDDQISHIPVVLVTTKNLETDRVWGMRQGARAYVTKPVKEAKLVDTINQCLIA